MKEQRVGGRQGLVKLIGGMAILLGGCFNARPVNFPVDPIGGQSLNSSYAEMTPRISQRYIVFASDRKGNQDIFLYDTVAQRLVDLPGLNALDTTESSPAISEDGRYIVFAGSRQGRSGIYLYDRDFRQMRNLTANLQAEVRNPMISADGNTIVFETNLRGQWDILVYNRAGQPLPGLDINPR
jgi:Tol biopolymer transport system component